jgi:hypothetical protein
MLYGLFKHLKTEINPIFRLLALLGAHPILFVSRIRVKDENIGGHTVSNYKMVDIL